MPPPRCPALSTIRWTIALAALFVGAVGAATLSAVASSAATKARVAEEAAFATAFNPGADHMGSTIRAHEPNAAGSGIGARAVPQVRAAVASQPYGMDVSAYQGNVDWGAASRAGGRFVYIKATESTSYVNPYFGQQYGGSAGAGLIRGAYHFALPNRSSGATQANYFVDHGGGWSADGRTLPPMLDIEYNPYGPTCYSMSTSAMSAWIADFSRTVAARTGRYPTIYSTRNWWNTCTGSNAGFGSTNPLFLANYSSSPGPMPAGWGFQTLWQYDDAGVFPGDQDVFNGSSAQLSTFARGSSAPAVVTPIAGRYAALGGSRSVLGAPVGGEYAVPGGRAQNYQTGRMYYSAATGTHEVHGAILDKYLALGGPAGVLGLPTTDETGASDGVGRYNHFSGQSGSIYWTLSTGAHEIQGLIGAKYAALGAERSMLGYPVTDEMPTPDRIGRFNHFSGVGGSIYWSPSTGAHEIQGAIRTRWASLGWERSVLGYPVSDELEAGGGGGRYNDFAGQSGSVYWSPSTGAHEVQGLIRAKWLGLGGSGGALGYPVSDEYAVAGGRRNDFVHGTAVWLSRTNVTTVTVVPPPTPTPTPTPSETPSPSISPTDSPSPTVSPTDDPVDPPVNETVPPDPTDTGGSTPGP